MSIRGKTLKAKAQRRARNAAKRRACFKRGRMVAKKARGRGSK